STAEAALQQPSHRRQLQPRLLPPPIPPPPAGFTYYEDIDSTSDPDGDDDDDDDAVNVRVSYVQHAEVVAQLRECGTTTANLRRRANLQQHLWRLPQRVASALGRMSSNLNCYQPTALQRNNRGTQTNNTKGA
ncbi:uncharacterized protein LOC115630779, partial [Scaptodrosophila lebanonensis]|uniref:Uncharacterized protein LOC115630779 n=1 Tax=Drosophila lebanonensis TaxID=7225 RepID=A0A6J2U4K9_DROLE